MSKEKKTSIGGQALMEGIRVKSELNRDYGSEEFLAKCVRNTANGGKFSSDRSILDYAENVWKV